MTEELRLWSIADSGDVEALNPLPQMPTELEFEELLVGNPEMLGPGLKLVGRQTPTPGGWLDLLAVDEDGRLVVYELKRGALVQEAVTQVLAYASDLDAMSTSQLAAHIADRSGSHGIDEIADFEQWYGDNFGGDDLSRLLPPRMVLVGLGVDPAAERIARFISGGPVDISLITFHGFARDGERLLARQVEVEAGEKQKRQSGAASVAEKRSALREYLAAEEYEAVFDKVYTDIRGHLPKQGFWVQPGKHGISFRLTEPGDSTVWKTYFGVQAGYVGPGVYSVSILPQAIHWGRDAFERLREAVDLDDWPHGGCVLAFKSSDEWNHLRPAVIDFVNAMMEARSTAGEVGA